MADVERDAAETRLNRLLNLILETAVEVLGFDAATVTARYQRGGMSTIAATEQRLVELDDAQYDARSGPCLSVLDQAVSVFLEDAAVEDSRWQHFSRTAAHLGVHSTLSLHIPTDAAEVAASLNFYARRRHELGEQQVRAAESFAAQLAAAIQSVEAHRATARLADDLAEAMHSRAVIEQAKGILMADERIDAERAFARLVELSQHSNTKLREVAQRLVVERSAPPGG